MTVDEVWVVVVDAVLVASASSVAGVLAVVVVVVVVVGVTVVDELKLVDVGVVPVVLGTAVEVVPVDATTS